MIKKILLFLTKFWPKRIWYQICLVGSVMIVVPLVVLGSLLIYTSQKAIKTTVLRDYQEIVIHATGEIRENILGAQRSLSATSAILQRMQADRWLQETALVELSLRNPAFERISLVNLDGQEEVTSALGTAISNREHEAAFKSARQGLSYISEIKISDNYIPHLTIAEPVRRMGKIKWVLMADFNLRGVWDLIDSIQIGRRGQACLIDSRGKIIAHRDKKLVLQEKQLGYRQVVIDIGLEKFGSLEALDEQRVSQLIAYAPVKGLNCGLVIMQPMSEVFVFSQMMKLQSALLILLSILLAMFISFYLARYVSRLMENIVERTNQLSRGDFSTDFKIKTRDEFGRLMFSFNRMADKLRKAKEAEKLSIIGRTAANIAHELKNSLQLVNTFVRLLPERHKDKKFIKDFSETIPKELDSWNMMLRSMMLDSRNAEVFFEKVSIPECIRDVLILMQLKFRQKDIQFQVNYDDHLPCVFGNEEKLKQVFLNLLMNAVDATAHGGQVAVRAAFYERGLDSAGYVQVEVLNNGEPIPEENLNLIFQPFFTTKEVGLGLGLAISREIVATHKGTVEAKSENGMTTFIVRMPAINVYAR